MEKLQSALERARKQRSSPQTDAEAPAPSDTQSDAPSKAPLEAPSEVMQDTPQDHAQTATPEDPTPAQAKAPKSPAPSPAPQVPQDPAGVEARWAALKKPRLEGKVLHHNRVVAFSPSAEATPFDVLRTKCVLRMRQNGWKRMVITSPTPSCGKSVISCNLAAAMSRQTDVRTILFDMDLRRPNIANTLGIAPETSVSDLLTGGVSFADHALRLQDNVAVATQRTPVDDPSRVILHHDSIALLSQIEEDYAADLMLFDMPPTLTGDETRGFLQHVDCALIVVRAGVTKTSQIDQAEREIAEETNVLGIALNQCRFMDYTLSDRYY